MAEIHVVESKCKDCKQDEKCINCTIEKMKFKLKCHTEMRMIDKDLDKCKSPSEFLSVMKEKMSPDVYEHLSRKLNKN